MSGVFEALAIITALETENEALKRRIVAMEDRMATRAARPTYTIPDCEYGCDLNTFGTHQEGCPFDPDAEAKP